MLEYKKALNLLLCRLKIWRLDNNTQGKSYSSVYA